MQCILEAEKQRWKQNSEKKLADLEKECHQQVQKEKQQAKKKQQDLEELLRLRQKDYEKELLEVKNECQTKIRQTEQQLFDRNAALNTEKLEANKLKLQFENELQMVRDSLQRTEHIPQKKTGRTDL